ncbi:MAG: SpoIIE family protein phosphatase [Bacteroidota bacterium]|nr:SpoIIE family protein phosphatase [Bacteroidota bacterium]
MLTISTTPDAIANKLYESKRVIKNTLNSFLTNTYNFLHSNNDLKLNSVEAELGSHIEILNRSALVSMSDLKGNIIYVNELFCKTSKFSSRELIGMPHSIIRHPDTPASVFKEMWATIAKGKVWQGELKNSAKDGSEYWVIATVAPVMGPNGKPKKYISVRYDITMQKKVEEELLHAKKKIDNELRESVEYAKYIHGAFLNTREDIKNSCNDSFLVYKAQKIISGDFYKIERRDGKLLVIVGDSTGHGVSASYISILALSIISRIVKFCDSNPAEILKRVNKELNKATHPTGKKHLVESADIMACCLDMESMQLNYASARMRGFIIRKGEVIFLEKDKCSIGETSKSEFKITNRIMDIEKGDCLYIFSDGLTDQFGGQQDKRIGLKKVVSILKEVNHHSMSTQKEMIEHKLAEWQNENEQTDDITLFGIRI